MQEERGLVLEELRRAVARLEGELDATRAQLAAAQATEEQLRVELESAKAEAAVAQAGVGHEQHLAGERIEALRRECDSLRAQLDECRQARDRAEQERAAVIAALGRKARKALGPSDA